jgi:hypothetical protein
MRDMSGPNICAEAGAAHTTIPKSETVVACQSRVGGLRRPGQTTFEIICDRSKRAIPMTLANPYHNVCGSMSRYSFYGCTISLV